MPRFPPMSAVKRLQQSLVEIALTPGSGRPSGQRSEEVMPACPFPV